MIFMFGRVVMILYMEHGVKLLRFCLIKNIGKMSLLNAPMDIKQTSKAMYTYIVQKD